jgi:branched-chain amino acid transport system ATP-binding protein
MLQVEGLNAGYGSFEVLRDVRLTVPDASVAALLGSNGAGKTTLLRAVSGLIEPWAGQVTWDGVDVTRLPAHRRSVTGLCHVPEGRGIFVGLTVRENLVLFSPPGSERAGLERALAASPALVGRLDQPAETLSGGQQQILALTRVYLSGARLILLDEVSMGLAPMIVDETFGFLGHIASEGVSLLVVEQYVHKALSIADYAYILSRGEVAFAGEAAELADEDVFSRYLGELTPTPTG